MHRAHAQPRHGQSGPNEQVDLSVTAAGKFNTAEISQPINATFSGAKSLDPTDEPVPYPPTFTFIAGPNKDDKGTINLEQVSNRGIGKKTVEFTVGTPQFGGTIHFHQVSNFLNATTTIDITAQVVMVVDGTSGQLTVEPAGGGTYSYDFDTTGGNKNCGSDAQNCPPGPPCTYHGEGNLLDPTHIRQGTTDGLIAPTGALGDDVIHLQVAVPISCGEYDLNYVSLASGVADGLEAKLDGDTTYKIDMSAKQDIGRPGYVNNSQAHVEGTLAPLDALRQPERLIEPLDEVECDLGHLAPAMVDRERVASVRDLDDLRDSRIVLLPLVRRVRDRPGHGVVLLAIDDQQRTPVGVLGVDLGLGPRVEVRIAHLHERHP